MRGVSEEKGVNGRRRVEGSYGVVTPVDWDRWGENLTRGPKFRAGYQMGRRRGRLTANNDDRDARQYHITKTVYVLSYTHTSTSDAKTEQLEALA